MKVNTLIDDDVFRASRVALRGLTSRQEAITQNIANIDTPGYEAQTVSFEKAVQNVIDRDQSGDLSIAKTNTAHLASPVSSSTGFMREYRTSSNYRADENNVDIDVEIMDMNETVMRYETITQLLARRYRLYKDVANSK